MKIILLVFTLIFNALPTSWTLDLDAALLNAKADNKYVLLYFSGSDWCGPCIKLKKEVYENDKFEAFSKQNLILVKADFPRKKANQLEKYQIVLNEKMAEKYNSSGKFPLTLLLDKSGKVLKEWEGYPKGLDTDGIIAQISEFKK